MGNEREWSGRKEFKMKGKFDDDLTKSKNWKQSNEGNLTNYNFVTLKKTMIVLINEMNDSYY